MVTQVASVMVFTLEYLLRLYCIAEEKMYMKWCGYTALGRVRWMLSFYALVDAAASFPLWVDLFLGT